MFESSVCRLHAAQFVLLDEETQLKGKHDLKQSYVAPEDELYLEDDNGRVLLVFPDEKIKEKYIEESFSGVVVAVIGKIDPRNSDNLIANEVILPGLPEVQEEFPSADEDKYIAFISGLEVDRSDENRQKIQLIVRYLSGLLGSEKERKEIVSRIARLIVVGNSVAPQEVDQTGGFAIRGSLRGASMKPRVGPSRTIDHLLSKLGESMEVDIMPGKNDPTNISLPQQPINRCMLADCSKYETINLVTNPYDFSLDGVHFMGVSGQSVDDIRAYTKNLTTKQILERLVQSSHFAPTAPDTLDCFPFSENDPLVFDRCPHVFFSGNQKNFESSVISEGERKLVCFSVPSFHEKANLVLLNLKDLSCKHIVVE